MKRDPVKVVMMWFLLLVYGVPTLFMLMIGAAGIKPVNLWILSWGIVATTFALWFGEQR